MSLTKNGIFAGAALLVLSACEAPEPAQQSRPANADNRHIYHDPRTTPRYTVNQVYTGIRDAKRFCRTFDVC